MADPIVLSVIQVAPLLAARRQGLATAAVSLDLGLTTVAASLETERALFPDGRWLSWEAAARIEHGAPTCFEIVGGDAHKIHRFSSELSRPYTLMATSGAPTLILAGFTMHRIVGIDPVQDTERKIRALGPPRGAVLDTCTGLGYTAIALARTASSVLTVELDPLVLEIARLNPYSQALFGNARIEQRVGDVEELIGSLESGQFAAVLHDPPTVPLAGELYGGAFYRELRRVLAPRGLLFHYTGDLTSKQGGIVAKGVLRRLREAGFARVTPRPEAFGIAAAQS